MDLSNHVLLPREDFYELQTSAWTPASPSDRLAGTLQASATLGALGLAVAGVIFVGTRLSNWYADRELERELKRKEADRHSSEEATAE